MENKEIQIFSILTVAIYLVHCHVLPRREPDCSNSVHQQEIAKFNDAFMDFPRVRI